MRLPSSKEAVGIRYTGWAALGRDPQEDTLEYTCPYCGEHGEKAARRTPDQYHFTDGFLQDLQGKWRHAVRAGIRCGLLPWSCSTTRTKSAGSKAFSRTTWFQARIKFPVFIL